MYERSTVLKKLLIQGKFVISPWQTPLPCTEYTTHKVVVYYYNGRWIPIMFYKLSDAIALHRKARQEGKEIYIFPAGMNPNDFTKQDVIVLAFFTKGSLASSGASQLDLSVGLTQNGLGFAPLAR